MIITYQFDTENEQHREELKDVQNAKNMYLLITEVRNVIFRPARKHGYADKNIQDLLDKCGDAGLELVEALEREWSGLLEEHNLED